MRFLIWYRLVSLCKVIGRRIWVVCSLSQHWLSLLLPGGLEHLISSLCQISSEHHGIWAHCTLSLLFALGFYFWVLCSESCWWQLYSLYITSISELYRRSKSLLEVLIFHCYGTIFWFQQPFVSLVPLVRWYWFLFDFTFSLANDHVDSVLTTGRSRCEASGYISLNF